MLANSSIKGNQERTVWTAFFLPKATPTAIVERLARATSDALDPLCQTPWHQSSALVNPPFSALPQPKEKSLGT
jgi:Tripartite tricarboxylate transporter family receptor